MTPILLSGETVKGFLPDATSCVVTEERNGIFELELTYPVAGPMFDELAVDRYIKAKPNDTAALQVFRIYEITKPIAGIVTVKGEHVSYALAHYPVTNVSGTGTAHQAVSAVLAKVNAYLTLSRQFSSSDTGWAASKAYKYQVGSARAALGGSEGSLLDTFGGEFEWDNYTVKLHQHRGRDTGVVVAYRKNMTDLKVTTSLDSAYTALFPYAIKDDTLVTIAEGKLSVQNTSGIADRVLIRDFSSDFQNDEAVTAAALKTKAQAYLNANSINAPSVNVTVSFIHLWQSPEYAELAALEKVSLCDWVTVRHEILGVDVKAQVIKTEYDCLAERYNKIELGSARANLGDTLRQTVADVTNLLKNIDLDVDTSAITAAYTQAIADATALITGADGGYVHLLPSGSSPQEIVISNIEDYTSPSAKVWRWNKNGLGYSSTGYSGTYKTAITANGQIIADSLRAGSISANVIVGGVLQSSDASTFFDLDNDYICVGNGDLYCKLRNGALTQHVTSNNALIGGLTSILPGASGKTAEVLFYDENQLGVRISKLFYNSSTGRDEFDPIAYFDTSEVKMYADRFAFYSGNSRAYITIESSQNKIEFHDGVRYRTLEGICTGISNAQSRADSAYTLADSAWDYADTAKGRADDAYSLADRAYTNATNVGNWLNTNKQYLLTKNSDISVKSICFNGGDTAFQVYNGVLSFGISRQPLKFYADYCEFVNGDVRINGDARISNKLSVDSICFNGGDVAFQVYNGSLAFGISAKPMSFWAQYYNFEGSDIRIQGTSLKQWIKNNLTPKNGGGWA